jgi:outer membrane murein-binding lipoprotein Lpp
MNLQDAERDALRNSAALVKFAAESPKIAPDDVIAPLVAAWEAAEHEQWSPAIAVQFWTAYSKLCDLVKPVTMDTVSMAETPTAPGNGWWDWWSAGRSRAQIHARQYLILLLFLVICSVGFGFVAGTSGKLSEDIDKLTTEGDQLAAQISTEISDIKTDLDTLNSGKESLFLPLDDTSITADTRRKIDDLRTKLQGLYNVADQLHSKANATSLVTAIPAIKYTTGDLSRLPILDNGYDNVRDYYQARREVRAVEQKVDLLKALYNALVPLLLGAVGAATYVVRLTSEQIKDSTFASSSPIRHVVRIALGSLVGLVVGLGVFNNELNLSSAALAFVAGYAIEPVFATFDGIAEKFRRT